MKQFPVFKLKTFHPCFLLFEFLCCPFVVRFSRAFVRKGSQYSVSEIISPESFADDIYFLSICKTNPTSFKTVLFVNGVEVSGTLPEHET